jgi:hypothetical protein
VTHDLSDRETPTRLGDSEILALVQSESRMMEKRIRRRDTRELIGAIIGGLLIAPGIFRGPVLARVGAAVMVAGLAFISLRLTRARHVGAPPASDLSLSVVDALRAELRRVETQIALLESVLWWYIAPVAAGAVMIVAGNRGTSLFTFGYAIVVALIAWALVVLNARAARRTLRPRKAELIALLGQFDT